MASKKRAPRKLSVRTPTKRKGHPQTNPNSLANLAPAWKKGDPSPNPTGRPKLLGESYKAWLEKVPEGFDKDGKPRNPDRETNATLVARAIGLAALQGDVSAAKEIRAATEGEKITLATWQTEIVDALERGALTAQQVIDELGMDDARAILIAAGQIVVSQSSNDAAKP